MTHVSPNLVQAGFRGYADDGAEGSATAKAAENVGWTQLVDESFRVRFVVDETAGGGENNVNLQLQRNLNGGGWVNVDGSSAVVRVFASPHVSEEGATTRQLTSGSGTFVTGAFDEADGIAGTNNQIDFSGGEVTEVEYVVQILSADVSDSDSVELRVIRAGGSLDGWTQTPALTVDDGAATPVSESKTSPSESLAALSADKGLSSEVLAHLVVQGQAPSEALAVLERGLTVPSEHLLGLVATKQSATEMTFGLVAQEQGFSEALALLQRARSIATEHLVGGVARSAQMLTEILKGEEFGVLVASERLLGTEAARTVPTEFTSDEAAVSQAILVPTEAILALARATTCPTEFFLADAPAPAMFRRFNPVMDGPSEPILDGVPRRQLVEFAAGEYATPFWLQTEAGLVIKIASLPWQSRMRVGSARVLSSDPG